MQRSIVQPADPGTQALAALKQWLGITRAGEDEMLGELLLASLAMCEAFTQRSIIEQGIEERILPYSGEQTLDAQPVRAIEKIEIDREDGQGRQALAPTQYRAVINTDGSASVQLFDPGYAAAVFVTLRAGIAADWASLPAPLRHGIMRLADFYYRDRGADKSTQPPASVTALWRPWRVMRLS